MKKSFSSFSSKEAALNVHNSVILAVLNNKTELNHDPPYSISFDLCIVCRVYYVMCEGGGGGGVVGLNWEKNEWNAYSVFLSSLARTRMAQALLLLQLQQTCLSSRSPWRFSHSKKCTMYYFLLSGTSRWVSFMSASTKSWRFLGQERWQVRRKRKGSVKRQAWCAAVGCKKSNKYISYSRLIFKTFGLLKSLLHIF